MMAQGISQNSFAVRTASPRTHVQLSGTELAKSLKDTPVTEQNLDDVVVLSATKGTFHLEESEAQVQLAEGESVMPLRFGPLQKAFDTIGEKQEWLLSHQPVIKTEGQGGDARIDFINYGGFVFDSTGGYQSHSVNPW